MRPDLLDCLHSEIGQTITQMMLIMLIIGHLTFVERCKCIIRTTSYKNIGHLIWVILKQSTANQGGLYSSAMLDAPATRVINCFMNQFIDTSTK